MPSILTEAEVVSNEVVLLKVDYLSSIFGNERLTKVFFVSDTSTFTSSKILSK